MNFQTKHQYKGCTIQVDFNDCVDKGYRHPNCRPSASLDVDGFTFGGRWVHFSDNTLTAIQEGRKFIDSLCDGTVDAEVLQSFLECQQVQD